MASAADALVSFDDMGAEVGSESSTIRRASPNNPEASSSTMASFNSMIPTSIPAAPSHEISPWPTADVFVVTYNAGKALIDVSLFAKNLEKAFEAREPFLPELVVFSLQEMAPLAQAFIGGQMMRPYFQRYEKALNKAARRFTRRSPYTMVTCRNVGMTGIIVLATEPNSIKHVQEAEVGFGAGDMANKGAVGVRFSFQKDDPLERKRTTELTFVATHLIHQEWNVDKRRQNWESIVSGLVFEDPEQFTKRRSTVPESDDSDEGSYESANERSQLLDNQVSERDDALVQKEEALQNISIYKPGTHLFIAGDLNYRISNSSPGPGAVFPNLKPDNPNHYHHFLKWDQLISEMKAGRVFQWLNEVPITFPPTYKLKFARPNDKDDKFEGTALVAASDGDCGARTVGWKWAEHRWPSWCDRILYTDISKRCPATLDENLTKKSDSQTPKMIALDYKAMTPMVTSDHCPVYLRMNVPVIEKGWLASEQFVYPENPLPDQQIRLQRLEDELHQEIHTRKMADPRITLPYPIDLNSWEHRARVKRWEWVIGWSILLGQSRNTIAITAAAALIAALGTWWYSSFSSGLRRV